MSCESKTIALPQLTPETGGGAARKVKKSKATKWRAIVLIGVHVLIAAHIVQWLVQGRTLSPIEPSESMQTLELGVVNAGAIFFAIALLATALFGRFICGWACHVVALQDACFYMMKKIGVRPKPFRSRLLMLVPLGLAFYMFLWPTVSRELLIPFVEWSSRWTGVGGPAARRRPPPLTGFQSELVVDDFWATFPEWYVAIPFLFVIGFAIVYFLGAKGFCFYGCPYGGFFAPVESVSPVRIRVTDACEGCGHCTSVCTSNVRVHEEVRDYGMVVDPGCMRCLDCVSVCPNDALYVGLGRPAVLAPKPRDEAQAASREAAKAKRKRQWDMTWPEEIAAGALWLAIFVSLRGFLDATPLLMAGALAGICTYFLWKAWGLIRDEHVRIHGWILKQKGRLRPTAALFILLVVAGSATTAWSGVTRYLRGWGV